MRKELNGILIFIGIIWGVFLIDLILPISFTEYGVVPRTIPGLRGIIMMPFLHSSFTHLMNNTVPLVVLLILLFSSHRTPLRVIACLTLMSGLLLWAFGRNAVHVGASGFIYALMAFLIVAGLLERRIVSIAISVLVGFLYGGTLLWGVIPLTDQHVSWEGHLLGAVAGVLFAWLTVKRKPGRAPLPVVTYPLQTVAPPVIRELENLPGSSQSPGPSPGGISPL